MDRIGKEFLFQFFLLSQEFLDLPFAAFDVIQDAMIGGFLFFLFMLDVCLLMAYPLHGRCRLGQAGLLLSFGLVEPAVQGGTVLLQLGQ